MHSSKMYIILSILSALITLFRAFIIVLENVLDFGQNSQDFFLSRTSWYCCECFENDFEVSRLSTKLQIFTTAMVEFDQSDSFLPSFIKSYLQSMSSTIQTHFAEICTLLNYGDTSHQFCVWKKCISFTSFENYLRSTMTQSCFNHLLVLHCHKGRTDSLSLAKCLQEFVDCRKRSDVFEKFN